MAINNELFGFSEADLHEEDFLVEVEVSINRIMKFKNISRKVLADRLGVTKSAVTQLLPEGGSNMTISKLAKVFAALDERVELTSESIRALNEEIDEKVSMRSSMMNQKRAQCLWSVQNQDDDLSEYAGSVNITGFKRVMQFTPVNQNGPSYRPLRRA